MPHEPEHSFEALGLSIPFPTEKPWGKNLDQRQFGRIQIALLDSINLYLKRAEERALAEPEGEEAPATEESPLVVTDLNVLAIGGGVDVWTPETGKRFRLTGGSFTVSEFVSVLFEDGATGAIFRTPFLQPGVAYSLPLSMASGLVSEASDNALKLTSSSAANITGTLIGTEEE